MFITIKTYDIISELLKETVINREEVSSLDRSPDNRMRSEFNAVLTMNNGTIYFVNYSSVASQLKSN